MRLDGRYVQSPDIVLPSEESVTSTSSPEALSSALGATASALLRTAPSIATVNPSNYPPVIIDDTAPLPEANVVMVDRNTPIISLDKEFPAPSAFDDFCLEDDPDLFGKASWFDRNAIEADIVVSYAYVACRNQDLRTGPQRPLSRARREFAIKSMDGWNRQYTNTVPADDLSSMPIVRTRSELGYLETLGGVTDEQVAAWRGQGLFAQAAYFWVKPMLVAEFRYIRKDNNFWTKFVSDERRFRSRNSRAIPFQALNMFGMRDSYLNGGFDDLTRFWKRIEAPRGCCVEFLWSSPIVWRS